MDATITVSQLAQVILFILVVVLGVYAAFILRRINAVTRHLQTLFSDNAAQLNKSAAHLAQVMADSAEVSSQLREGFNAATKTIKVIGQETADTVLTLNKTADYVSTYAVVIQEAIKILVKLFAGQDKK
jgi:methyl-accepting chemotaxis protein